jgi:NAD(P)-dependent dehydrogenase (short-subunit alcohol dehydrogenase family)
VRSSKAIQEFGRLDVLVNNAVFQMTRETFDETPDDEWDRTFQTNITTSSTCASGGAEHAAGLGHRQYGLGEL